MLGSIFIGLGGMNAFSAGLRQISNNITNINTAGYKSTGLSFSDLYGRGSDQSGQGVSLSNARLDFSQGELRQSDRDLDLAIDGGGFLVLLKDADTYFARTGSFEIDRQGYIVLAGSDYRLAVLDESGNPTHVSIDSARTNPPQKTTTIKFADNLSSTATTFSLQDLEVFDSTGKSDKWRVRFERSATSPAGEWSVIVTNSASAEVGRQTLRFIGGVVDPATSQLVVEDTASGRSVTLDFSSNVTSFSSGEVSTLRTSNIDGHGVGDIVSIAVNDLGKLEITYSNEEKASLGSVAIADVRDPQALTQEGAGLFSYGGRNGLDFRTSEHKTAGRVLSKRTEASNVDLSREFGDLILVQRGFQASSQVVSVSNEMVQQLFGIRGQG